MSKSMLNKMMHRSRRGLILLLALGMLALFSLLAVTYIVAASNSRAGAQAMKVRANASATTTIGLTDAVIKQAIRGTRDHKSVFYQHSLLEDVYGQHPIRGRFGHLLRTKPIGITNFTGGSSAGVNPWCFRLQEVDGMNVGARRNFVKLSLFPKSEKFYNEDPLNALLASANAILSPFENAYNSRLVTIQEGPLAGQSFRILKYVGYVRTGGGVSGLPDPNYQAASSTSINDPNGNNIDYSILVDLSEIESTQISGTIYDFVNNTSTNYQGTLDQWLSFNQGLESLFYRRDPNSGLPSGYAFVINDAAFNNPGIGINDVDDLNPAGSLYSRGFGNLDARQVMAIPTTFGARMVPPALLPNYDYLFDPAYVNPLNLPLGSVKERSNVNEKILRGSSNEGYDVPDWRDFWLAHQSFLGGSTEASNIIPSFHRPEVIHYLTEVLGTSTPSNAQLLDLIRLINASTGRVMSYNIPIGGGATFSANPEFAPNPRFPRLQSNNSDDLIEYVAQHIVGPWDVDNDFDGIPDSVWIDPNLPAMKSPDGKLLKPLAAVLIQDLDGRINVNLHGDRAQAVGTGFDSQMSSGFTYSGRPAPQGLGFGPADISLRPLRDLGVFKPQSFQNGTTLSFFDDRYGRRRTLSEVAPGISGTNDATSYLHARDKAWPFTHGNSQASPGAPLGIRTDVYASFDRYGNLAYQSNLIQGANPSAPTANQKTNPALDDPYELRTLNLSTADDPFTLIELESVLRKFDQDTASLPSRLRDKYQSIDSVRAELARLLTVRSVELTHPNLSASMTKADATGSQLIVQTNNPLMLEQPNFNTRYGTLATANDANLMGVQGLIKMLHDQRYRRRSIPANPATDDPELTIADINVLFGQEFAQGKKLNLNRPFGNGMDENGNGVIDEPGESEAEDLFQYSTSTQYPSYPQPVFARGIHRAGSLLRAQLGSRQVLARNLYCLAQLIVPRDYRFTNMPQSMQPDTLDWYRVRAYNLAQWAVNVVDFRDNDATCTRFEYDIFPFGFRPGHSQIADRPPFWAPDLLPHVINPPTPPLPAPYNSYTRDFVKPFIGVAWGMESPELLLTESLAFHDKRLRDTDLDNGIGTTRTDSDPNKKDLDLDQYRFPQGSLFLELYAPRTTSKVDSDSQSRVDSKLYRSDNSGKVFLDLQATNDTDEPVWRIGISDVHIPTDPNNPSAPNNTDPNNLNVSPNVQYQANNPTTIATRSLEFNPAAEPQNNGTIEQEIGSGLHPYIRGRIVPSTPPQAFDRIIWFLKRTNARNALHNPSLQVPDLRLHANIPANKRNQVYHLRTDEELRLSGGEYLTLMPRVDTPVGSLNYNPDTFAPWPKQLVRTEINTSTRPIYSPSRQSISLVGGRCQTTLLTGVDSLLATPWRTNLTNAPHRAVVIGTNIPYGSGNSPNPSWTTGFPVNEGVGLNISMPHPISGYGYWRPQNALTQKLNSDAAAGFVDFDTWLDTSDAAQLLPANKTDKFKDHPFDYDDSLNPVLARTTNPTNRTGTYPNVRTAYLQRLADPRREYDAVYNPYLTVDWISIDLTVFNGEAPMGSDAMEDDPSDLVNIANDLITSTKVSFQSRYKDGDEGLIAKQKASLAKNQPDAIGTKNLNGSRSRWGLTYHSASTAQLRETPIQSRLLPNVNRRPYFPIQLGYASQLDVNNPPPLHNSATTFGYANVGYHFESLEITNASASQFDGVGPPQPPVSSPDNVYAGFPSDLTNPVWLNRPFASTHELMLVPFTSASRYGITWNIRTPQSDTRHDFSTHLSFLETNPSKVDATSVTPNPPHPDAADPLYRAAWGQFDKRVNSGPLHSDLALLLDFVETGSPFSDSVVHTPGAMIMNHVNVNPMNPPNPQMLAIQRRFLGLQPADGTLAGGTLLPPFNELSTFRAPGKVNLNTMARLNAGSIPALRAIEYLYAKIETGVFDSSLTPDLYDEPFFLNRRGYSSLVSSFFNSGGFSAAADVRSSTHLNSSFPTQFAGAYRPQLSSVFAPDLTNPINPSNPRPPESTSDLAQDANEQLRNRYSVEAGILRSQDSPTKKRNDRDIGSPDTPRAPNAIPRYSPSAVTSSDASIDANSPWISDANRNAFTRYQRMMRLPNLVTDQSNVFAVWVTVGLFEYDPINGFGREYVNASGEEQRERSFYIIDRTVPVGFVPGEDLNTQKTILLRRKISSDR